MLKYNVFISFLFIAFLTGCAHPIQISPDLASIRTSNASQSNKTVGYYISPVDIATEVKTPGGGGDDVKYFPYKDTEAALKTILSAKFSKVYSLKSQNNDPLINEKNISFIFIPKIKTDSSSSSIFTWPPTDFTVELTCRAYSDDGKQVWEKTVVGKGHAEFDEFKNDLSLSAKRASQEAFTLMRDEILASAQIK